MFNTEENIPLSILRALFKYKWLWLLPFLLAMSGVSAYTKGKHYYKSSATLKFHTEFILGNSGRNALSPFEEGIQELISSVKFGSKLEEITNLAYPGLKEKNPAAFKSKSNAIGSSEGVKLSFRRDYFRALVISYTTDNPKDAYNVVDATIKVIKKHASSGSDSRIENSMSFLLSNMDKLKQEMIDIDQEMISIKNNLSPLIGADLSLSDHFSNDSLTPLLDKGIDKSMSYKESLPKLEFELHVAEKELERLQTKLSLPIKEIVENNKKSSAGSFKSDPLIQDLEKSLLLNEKKHNLLRTQGFKNAHPKQVHVISEIENLKNLLAARKNEIKNNLTNEPNQDVTNSFRDEIRTSISQKNEEIAQVKDKIKILESYQADNQKDKNKLSKTLGTISKQKSRLEELVQQKYVKSQAYNNTAQDLEEKRRFKFASDGNVGLRLTLEEPPLIPNSPLPYAHLSLYLIATMFSLGLGFGLIFLIESLDTSIKNLGELEVVTKMPVLGSIDKFTIEEKKCNAYILSLESFLIIVAMIITYSFVLKFGA